MKVQQIKQQNIIQSQQHPQFGGATDLTLRYLATNQAIGANGVDFCCMVTPRTASDTIKRGPAAGLETFRREIMGTVNDTCVGLFGAAAGAMIAGFVNKKYGTDINKIFTAPETLKILAENKEKQIQEGKSQLDYIKDNLNALRAYNPAAKHSDTDGYIKLSDQTINEVSKLIDQAFQKDSEQTIKTWTSDKSETLRHAIMNKITEDTGAQSKYILESSDKKIQSHTNLKAFLNDLFIVSKSFDKEKVNNAFKENLSAKGENAFVKSLAKFMKARSYMGFAIASAIGLSVQPINMYLTKLKTGNDGFVGVEGRSKDTSKGFLGIKGLSSVAFFSMVVSTMNIKPWQLTPKKFMDKMAFTGKMPTINQLKGIYGITIISRIFSARDKDELREVLTKDSLGFLSWLVLGDIVNRMAAAKIDKNTMNYKKGTENSSYFKKMFNATLKTRDEILVKTLADNGIATTKMKDGKLVAKTFKELETALDNLNNPAVKKAVKKSMRTLNIAQCAGYLFSGLVLGLGIPNLNIYITNKLDQKRKAQAKESQNLLNQ